MNDMLLNWLSGFGIFAVFFIINGLAFRPIHKKLLSSYNPIDKMFERLLMLTTIIYVERFFEFTINFFYPEVVGYVFGVGLKRSFLLLIILEIAQLSFITYIYKAKWLYTAPLIIGFFITLYLIYFQMPYLGSLMLVLSTLYTIFYLYHGIRHNNGTLFGFAFFIIGYTLAGMISQFISGDSEIIPPFFFLGPAIGALFLWLGTSGWLERHLLFDRQKERQIKNTWISQLVQVAPPASAIFTQKRVFITCPVCQATNQHVFSQQEVESRQADTRGIVLMKITNAETCGHNFMIYVDRNCTIRCSEPISTSSISMYV